MKRNHFFTRARAALQRRIAVNTLRQKIAVTSVPWAVAAIFVVAFAACSDENNGMPDASAGALSSFTASVTPYDNALTSSNSATRAVTDPFGSFDNTAFIYLWMNGKRYLYNYNAAAQCLEFRPSPEVSDVPPYWADAVEADIVAYGSTSSLGMNYGNSSDKIYVFKDQSADSAYRRSDFVYAVQTLRRDNPTLTFRHGTARAVVRLRPDGITTTAADLAGASVFLGGGMPDKNQNVGNLYVSAIVSHADASLTPYGWQCIVTPHRCPSAPAGYEAAWEALLVPQDVTGKLFICVTLADGRTLGYAPATADEGLLEGGYTYTYNVTVHRDRLTVIPSTGDVPWTDSGRLTGVSLPVAGKKRTFYLIGTAEDLALFADSVNNHGRRNINALQTADIDLADLASSSNPDYCALADNWVPICKGKFSAGEFVGIYNGNGYTISSLRINKGGVSNGSWGLFGNVGANALLTGICLRDAQITGYTLSRWVGTLAGRVDGATVSLCSATGKIEVNAESCLIGGLIGITLGTSVVRCGTDVEVTADVTLIGEMRGEVGGIVGFCSAGSLLFACHATGNVTLTGRHPGNPSPKNSLTVGGITGSCVGYLDDGRYNIYCCVAEGAVSAACETAEVEVLAGGLVGHCGNLGTLGYSYARGTATATGAGVNRVKAGALVGKNFSDINVLQCYGAGIGGQGTSNLDAVPRSIHYNTNPKPKEIYKVLRDKVADIPASVTLYDAALTPAYGNEVMNRRYSDNVWQPGDGPWPVINFTDNGR